MPTLTDDQILDMAVTTLSSYGPPRFGQIAQTWTDYEILSKWMKKDKIVVDSGTGVSRALLAKLGNRAAHVGLHAQDEYNFMDLMTRLTVTWARAHVYWGYERRQALENRGRALLCNVIEPQRVAALIEMADELEGKAWNLKDPANDVDSLGVPYWIVANATQGFNGGLPSGYTTVGGVNITTYPTFKNWTDTFTNISESDFLRKMRLAHLKINFKSPVNSKEFLGAKGERFRVYMGDDMYLDLAQIAMSHNNNLGIDLAPMDGVATFKRHPLVHVPYLETFTDKRVYMIDHDTFYPVVLRGDYLRETKPRFAPNQHNTVVLDIDLSYQYVCVDRRGNAVLYQA